ncbi:hydroxymethylglutaryl-CoA lyase [Achromobacter seleniivolatilans]|uniref:Hydroxymethylglutaryl-CoA lyase n=1 Tax=Achromobacter seleniivolatilans TaxID=3047478 RepID=A0ABY9M0U6_9BURK|nr:hydroxymethylglutaryl-CoA lyase [Achromobacter sp. R39]WMD20631.1 hydroxymethylglutaryl-CoA lyase [Achromobacter sp. R39]
MSARDVVLCECFARDGLQHEPEFIGTQIKAGLIDRFAALGFERVEATSYSNPKVVPQFADASELLAMLPRRDGVWYKATCANARAVQRALADLDAGIGANEISLLVSASASHSLRNLKRERAAQWENITEMAELARGRLRMVGTISVAFGCPFEGAVDPESVMDDVRRFAQLGVGIVTLGDTTGMATPAAVRELYGRMLREFPQLTPVAHFHDTRGTGLVNYVSALDAGVRHFDCAFGGVGGHPAKVRYGGGHTGNVATEDLVSLFESMGVSTGLDLDALDEVSQLCQHTLGRPLHSRVAQSGLNPLISGARQALGAS